MPSHTDVIAEIEKRLNTEENCILVVQFLEQHGKYNVNIGEGKGNTIGDNLNVLDTDLLIEVRDWLRQQTVPSVRIDWQKAIRAVLRKQMHLTSNPITHSEDIAHQVDQIYVPLGLKERKKVPRRKADVTPERGSDLYCEEEITQQFEHKEFLKQVLQQEESPKSQGRRIAIIGEPGAGKTTLLQQIAQWIADTFSEAVVIWISLANLQRDTVENYVEKIWLQCVVRAYGTEVTPANKAFLSAQFKLGRVWLLLDGLDEMQVAGNPLSEIQRQLQEGGWVQQARVLLTCRLNLWDGNRNTLAGFDTYRTLEFAYPDQVEQFIERWFAPINKTELGSTLGEALQEPGRERIRNLVKNPLRLMLLCFSWCRRQGHLPDTQMGLYRWFVDQIYDWKKEQFPTAAAQRQQLNQALAHLSRDAIDDAHTHRPMRFILRQEFVSRYLDETLLDLALEIGWLNKVGVDADDPDQSVYAFYHLTFEEYFAALGINDRGFFLNHNYWNPLAKEASYRIFEPQWKQVLLLWLGREDINQKQKNGLIESMIRFQDSCGELYSDRALFLAVKGIAEFKKCTYAHEVVDKLVQLAFGPSGWLEQVAMNLLDTNILSMPLSDTVLEVLSTIGSQVRKERAWDIFNDTNFSNFDKDERAIQQLIRILETGQDTYARNRAAYSLGKIAPGNKTAIRALVNLLKTAQDEGNRWRAADSLGEIAPGNKTAIQALVNLLEITQDEDTRWRAADSLCKIAPGNKTAIQALIHLSETAQDKYIRREAADRLEEITPGNKTAIQALVDLLGTTQDKDIRWRAAIILSQISPGNKTAIQALVNLLEITQDEDTRWRAADSLGKISPDNETAIQTLVHLSKTTQDEYIRCRAATSLAQISPDNKTAIQALVDLLGTTQDKTIRMIATFSLNKIMSGNKTAIQVLIHLLKNTRDENTRRGAAAVLEEIAPGNDTAIRELIHILKTTQDEDTRWRAADSLGKISPGNDTAIQTLIHLSKTTQDEDTRWRAADSLGKIAPSNDTAIRALVYLFETTQDKDTCWRAADSLGKIAPGNDTAIRALVHLFETTQDKDTRWRAADSLGKIAPGNDTAIRALVHLFETTQDEDTRWRAADGLGKIARDNEIAIRALIHLFFEANYDEDTHFAIHWRAAAVLKEIASGNDTAIRELLHLLETTQDKNICWRAADGLEEIAPGNDTAIRELVRILKKTQNKDIRWYTAYCLNHIAPGNKTAVQELLHVLKTSGDKERRFDAADSLSRITPSNEDAKQALLSVLKIAQDKDIRLGAFRSLSEITFDNKTAIEVIQLLCHNPLHMPEVYEFMMKCAETMPYRDFHQAFHSSRWPFWR